MSRLPPMAADGRGRRIALVVITAIGQGVAAGIIAFATRDVFNALRIEATVFPTLAILEISFGGVMLAALRLAERIFAERVGQDYAAAVRERLFLHMTRRPVGKMSEQRIGAMSLRFVGDLSAIKGWISSGLARLISCAITIVASLIILYILNPSLGLAAIPAVGVSLAFLALLGPRLASAHAELRKRRSHLAADMTERLPQATALRRFGRLKQERRNLNKLSEHVAQAAVHRAFTSGLLQAIPDLASAAATVLLMIASWQAGLSVAETAAALTTMALTVRPMRQLAGVWDRRQAWVVARNKLERTLSAKRLPLASSIYNDAHLAKDAVISFDNLTLPGAHPITATVNPGEWTRLDGPDGAGKTTLLLIAAGLDIAPTGTVSVLGKLPFGAAPNDVVYIGPFSPILKGTLRRNISIGAAKVPDEATLKTCIEQFQLAGLLNRLGGIDGVVAEGGANLSRAEIACLLAARALVVQPVLILIDADEIGLGRDEILRLAQVLKPNGTAALIASRDPQLTQVFSKALNITVHTTAPHAPLDSPSNFLKTKDQFSV